MAALPKAFAPPRQRKPLHERNVFKPLPQVQADSFR
jgi:hypothetical protein